MSTPSFRLYKRGGTWWAEADVGNKKPVRISCGDGSKKTAEEIAGREIKRRAQLAAASKARWAKAAAAKNRPSREDPDPEPLSSADDEPLEAPAPELDPSPAPAADRAAEIQAKLRGLGASPIVEPDAIHGPDDAGGGFDGDDAPMDNEAGELLADLFAAGIVAGHIKLVGRVLKRRRPPQRPGEPNDRMLTWERDGLSYNIAKLVGKTTTMGPTAKMLVGAGLMTVGMFMDAEPLEGAPAEAAPAPPPPPAPAADESDERPQTTTDISALGRFR